MIDRLADLRPLRDDDDDEEGDEEGEDEGVRGDEGEGVERLNKFETDLRQLMDGILDLKRRCV